MLSAFRRFRSLAAVILTVVGTAVAAPVGSETPQGTAASDATSVPRVVVNQSHAGAVTAVSLSADGRLMASVDGSEVVKIWDVAIGRLLRSFYTGPELQARHVALSPDGRLLAVDLMSKGYRGGGVAVWQTIDGREVIPPDTQDGEIHWLHWSPDSRRLAIGGHQERGVDDSFQITVLDASKLDDPVTGGLLHVASMKVSGESSAAFLADGRHLAYTFYDGSGSQQLGFLDTTSGLLSDRKYPTHDKQMVANGSGLIAVKHFQSIDIFTIDGLTLTTEPHSEYISDLTFSRSGTTIYALDSQGVLVGWNVKDGRKTSTLKSADRTRPLRSIRALLPGGSQFLSSAGTTLQVRDLATGTVSRTIGESVDRLFTIASVPAVNQVLTGGASTLSAWDVGTGRHVRKLDVGNAGVAAIAPSGDGQKLLLGFQRRLMRVVETATGKELAKFTDSMRALSAEEQRDPIKKSVMGFQVDIESRSYIFGLSPDGTLAAHGRSDGRMRVFDAGGGDKPLYSIDKPHGAMAEYPDKAELVTAMAFSPDGRLLATGGGDKRIHLRNPRSGEAVRVLDGHAWTVMSLTFLPDGRHLASGGGDRNIIIWEVGTGRIVRKIAAHDAVVKALVVTRDGKFVVSGSSDSTVKVWTIATGELVHTLQGHVGEVTAVGLSPDGTRVLSAGDDATLRVWDIKSGVHLATFITATNGDWLAMTPHGFFSASKAGASLLSIVRGAEVTTIDQVHQSLYNPDLLREALAGDVNGEVKAAAGVVNLQKILDSGPAPSVTLTLPAGGGAQATLTATMKAQITDRGKGIGRIEWRVNGVTAAVGAARGNGGPVATVTQPLALDPGDNLIEVLAYDAKNLLASVPARTVIKVTAQAQATKPKLHILAIGINGYTDSGGAPAGQNPVSFGPLNLAVKDAKSFAEAMRRAAGSVMYAEVRLEVVPEDQATRTGIDRAFSRFAEGIDRRDTFVLFIAAHGHSHDGRFYLIPHDYQGGTNPQLLAERAVSQEQLQDWLANRIKARKAIVFLDTCESGALISGHRRSRLDSVGTEATVGRLHEATGRPVLAAAAQGQFAHEGVIGESGTTQGIFTWAVLDAMRNGDRNKNGTIELTEIVAHVQDEVPRLAAKLGGLARSATAAEPVFGQQTARFGSRGEDFVLVRKLP